MHITAQRGRPISERSLQVYATMDRQTELQRDIRTLDKLIRAAECNLVTDLSDNDPQRLVIEAMQIVRGRMAEQGAPAEQIAAIDEHVSGLSGALEMDLRDDQVKREALDGLRAIRREKREELDKLTLQNRILERKNESPSRLAVAGAL